LHHPGYFSNYVPKWLEDLGMTNQPKDMTWMPAYKVRMIKSKIQEQAATDPVEAFRILDQNGSDEMNRLEIIEALMRIGLYMSQSDVSLLMGCLDEDGGGTISEDEFVHFWRNYSFA
jgi:Ca2+-binding EF-hand superfamily protein